MSNATCDKNVSVNLGFGGKATLFVDFGDNYINDTNDVEEYYGYQTKKCIHFPRIRYLIYINIT